MVVRQERLGLSVSIVEMVVKDSIYLYDHNIV